MTSILVDSRGSPVFDAQGNIQTLHTTQEFKQRLLNAFKTQLGTEIFFPTYGFDFMTACRLPNNGRKELLKMLALETLNFDSIQNLMIINSCEVYLQTGASATTGIIAFTLTDNLENRYSDTIGVAY
jgi:hypothetical protein